MVTSQTVVAIVDDDPSVRRAVGRLLRSRGFGVEEFRSAETFLESDWRGRVSCLVLDVHLEGESGFELQERLVAMKAGIPVVFITAFEDEAGREHAVRCGAAGYLGKPFDANALLEALAADRPHGLH